MKKNCLVVKNEIKQIKTKMNEIIKTEELETCYNVEPFNYFIMVSIFWYILAVWFLSKGLNFIRLFIWFLKNDVLKKK